MGWLVIIEFRSKTFNTTCVVEHAFHEKRYTTLLERQFKLSGLIKYSPWVLKDLNVSVVTRCLYISHLVCTNDLQQPFFFSRGATFAITRISFKLLALLNQIIGIFSKTFHVLCQVLIVSVFQIVHF